MLVQINFGKLLTYQIQPMDLITGYQFRVKMITG